MEPAQNNEEEIVEGEEQRAFIVSVTSFPRPPLRNLLGARDPVARYRTGGGPVPVAHPLPGLLFAVGATDMQLLRSVHMLGLYLGLPSTTVPAHLVR